jgi:hypothetical protein
LANLQPLGALNLLAARLLTLDAHLGRRETAAATAAVASATAIESRRSEAAAATAAMVVATAVENRRSGSAAAAAITAPMAAAAAIALSRGRSAPAVAVRVAAATAAARLRFSRARDRQSGDARGKNQPGHWKISFRTE